MARGSEYERQIAAQMRAQGARRVSLRQKKRGATGARPHEVDVHAEFYSRAWDVVARVAWMIAIVGVVALALALVDEGAHDSLVDIDVAAASASGLTIVPGATTAAIGIAGALMSWLGRERVERHVWIECKDHRRPVKRDHVIKLAEQVAEVRAAGHGWQPTEVWIASSSGFDQDAEAFAAKHGIRCATIPRA